MTTTAKLSPAMLKALRVLLTEGVVFAYNGHSRATIQSLIDRGLAEFAYYEVKHHYGPLGSRGGTARGQRYADWSAKPTDKARELGISQ
jgi:hypothetical protein